VRAAFTDDQLLLRDAVRDLLQAECSPTVVRAAWSDGHRAGLWQHLADMGAAGMTAPEALGGAGLGEIDLVLLAEESGRVADPGPLVDTTAVGIPALVAAGVDDEVREAANGGLVVSALIGGAPFALHADVARLFLIEADGALWAVPRAAVTLEPVPSIDGARRLARVQWTRADGGRRLDGPGTDPALAFDRGALATSAQLCGLARAMIDLAVDYAKQRHQFGVPIGSYQAVKHHLADALLALEYARPLVHRAAWVVAQGDVETPDTRAVAVSCAKATASASAEDAARAALQVHGAIGYTLEHDLHLFMKRAWALAASWGDAAWHRRRVADLVL
jgi:alkylation response protein AidB-like acyl-CoA dehydrogenase